MSNPQSKGVSTLSAISRQYGCCVKSLMFLLEAHADIMADIDFYTKKNKNKACKLLPPIVVNKIFATLGEP